MKHERSETVLGKRLSKQQSTIEREVCCCNRDKKGMIDLSKIIKCKYKQRADTSSLQLSAVKR